MLKICLNIVLLLFSTQILQSQSISLSNVDDSDFPEMKGELIILDENARQISNISTSELTLSRKFSQLKVLNIDCLSQPEPDAISSVLMLDISGSMLGKGINIAEIAATKWIELMDMSRSECAVGSFNTKNHFIQDFTRNKDQLLESVGNMPVYGGTDFNAAFINSPAGALKIVEKGRFKRVIVLLTDGSAEGNESEIIQCANELNAAIYCVVLNQTAPQLLKNISEAANGRYFDNIVSEEDAVNAFMQILYLARGGEPCEITWLENNCITSEFINIEYQNISSSSYVPISEKEIALFEFSDNGFLDFSNSEPGQTITKNITITAKNQDIRVNSITTSSVLFSITDWGGNRPPFTLTKDDSRTLKVEFAPIDSLQVFCNFIIDADACNNNFFFASGGFKHKLPGQKYIEVIHPNGGEKFRTNFEVELRWRGVTNDDPVELEFSPDNGVNWENVGTSNGNEPVKWVTPSEESRDCLIRVSQNYDDKINKVVYTQHKSKVNTVDWSDDNEQVASGSKLLQVHIWNPLSGEMKEQSEQFMFYDMSFDWNGDFLTSCDYQRGINVWDTESNLVSNPFKNSSQKFSNIAISPSSLYLIASEEKFNTPDVLLWSINSGELSYNFNGHAVRITDIAWSTNGIHFASCDEDSKIYIWSRFEKNHVSTFRKDDVSSALSLSFDNSGSRLLCAYSDSSLIVWDYFAGKRVDSTKISDELINCVEWGSDGIQIAAGCESGAVYLMRYFGGKFQSELIGTHKAAVNDIQLSDDNIKILSGSDDSTAVVWYLNGIRLSDTSDSVFAIIRPRIETKIVDMGYSYKDRTKDSVVKEFLMNQTDITIRIDSIVIEQDNVFKLISNIDDLILRPGESKDIEFSFRPLSETIYTSPVVIYSENKIFETEIKGIGYGDVFLHDDVVFDFGKVLLSNEKTIRFYLSNNTTREANLKKPILIGPDMDQFTFSYEGNLNLFPGDDLKFEATFAPNRLGRTTTVIKLQEEGYDMSSYITLYGEGITLEGSANISVVDAEAASGDKIDIRIVLSDKENFEINQVSNVYADLSFNKTLLVPIDGLGLLEERNRIYSIKIDIDNNSGEQEVQIPAIATLGNSDYTELTLDNVFADNGNIVFNIESGVFNLLDVCDTGELRLVQSTGTYIFDLKQSNSELILEFGMIEKTDAEIEIINSNGTLVDKIYLGQLSIGSYAYHYSLDRLNSGLYFLKLTSSTGVLVKKFMNIK